MSVVSQAHQESIAIIGMSGRFPQASSVEEFWRNLREGRESISQFTVEEVLADTGEPLRASEGRPGRPSST